MQSWQGVVSLVGVFSLVDSACFLEILLFSIRYLQAQAHHSHTVLEHRVLRCTIRFGSIRFIAQQLSCAIKAMPLSLRASQWHCTLAPWHNGSSYVQKLSRWWSGLCPFIFMSCNLPIDVPTRQEVISMSGKDDSVVLVVHRMQLLLRILG